ncbi:CRISPR-associated endonuclease Cas1 [Clostridium ihumii]|uniref:CRISPR-associated endonuclease Cas1 n=1 Tax=Clostridium ihumii TaxID=1470356 RepID=UPI003D347C07
MELIINTRGAFLSKTGDRFKVKVGDKSEEYSSKKVSRIIMTTAASITTDAMKLAMENNIDIVLLEYNGMPFGRIWHSKLGSVCTIRRNQLKLNENEFGTSLVKEWISTKMTNQANYLKKLEVNRSLEKQKNLSNAIEKIENEIEKVNKYPNITISKIRNSLEGHEGTAGRIYFEALGKIIPDKYKFKGRSKNPAKDEFNCMLNYAYGMLYSKVERACVIAELDPYIGIMHTDNYNKTALVFDVIEVYRHYMDEIVFSLFTKRLVKDEMFDKVENGLWLNSNGKALLIEKINTRFEEQIRYKGKLIKINNVIQYDLHKLANEILEKVI